MQSTWMILYMLFFGIIAAGIWVGRNKKNIEGDIRIYSIKSVLFFFAGIWFLVSAIKFYLGDPQSTLTESFWDMESRTYLHDGIVFMAFSVMAPLLMKWILSSYGDQLVQIFDFIYVAAIVTGLLLFGRIENRTYCILYMVCMLAEIGIAVLHHKIYRICRKSVRGGLDRSCILAGLRSDQAFWKHCRL